MPNENSIRDYSFMLLEGAIHGPQATFAELKAPGEHGAAWRAEALYPGVSQLRGLAFVSGNTSGDALTDGALLQIEFEQMVSELLPVTIFQNGHEYPNMLLLHVEFPREPELHELAVGGIKSNGDELGVELYVCEVYSVWTVQYAADPLL
jgi:hypothetical protein